MTIIYIRNKKLEFPFLRNHTADLFQSPLRKSFPFAPPNKNYSVHESLKYIHGTVVTLSTLTYKNTQKLYKNL